MFREMRRIRQQAAREECEQILRKAPRGVLAVRGAFWLYWAMMIILTRCRLILPMRKDTSISTAPKPATSWTRSAGMKNGRGPPA